MAGQSLLTILNEQYGFCQYLPRADGRPHLAPSNLPQGSRAITRSYVEVETHTHTDTRIL